MIVVDTSAVVAIAFAKVRGLPLLSKGNDFSETDIAQAWSPSEHTSRGQA